MQMLVYLIIGLIVGYLIGRKMGVKVEIETKLPNEQERQEKQKHLEQIINYLSTHEQVANNDVEKMFSVSDATAERYLNQLEREGRIEQIGKTGRNVIYRRK